MTDSQYKVVQLDELDPLELPDPQVLRPNTVMEFEAQRQVGAAQDAVVAGSRRVVGRLGLSGAPGFHSTSPAYATWRTAGWIRTARLTPGCFLQARVYYVGSGPTTDGSPYGAIRLTVDWIAGESGDGPDDYTLELAPSDLDGAAAPSDDAGLWAALEVAELGPIRPNIATNANLATFSADLEVVVEVQFRGGSRVVCVVLYEEPVAAAFAHDDEGPHAINGQSATDVPQLQVPQTKAADGATYDEHRFGTHRLLGTAQRQQEVVGPVIFDLQVWDENTASDDADVSPISITSTSFVNILDTTQTSYDASLPGFVVAGSHAQVYDLCDAALFRTDEIWHPDLEQLYCPRSGQQGTNDGTTYDEDLGARHFDALGDDCRWALGYDITNNAITIALWLRITDMTAMRRPILLATAGGTAALFIDVFTGGNVRIWWEHDGGGSVDMQRTTVAGVITANTWHHVAIRGVGSSTASTWSIVVDGAEAAYSGGGTNGVGTPRASSIFALSYYVLASPTNGWLGDIADVRAWSRVVDVDELANIRADALDDDGEFAGFPEPQRARACVIPGRVRLEARLQGLATAGTVRVQSGPYEWIDLAVSSSSWTVLESTGFFESQVVPEHASAVLQVFAMVDAGTLQIRPSSACFGQ